MKIIQKIFNEAYKDRIFKVRSNSEPDVYYEVFIEDDGSLSCTCAAGTFKSKTCKHREKVKKRLLFYEKEENSNIQGRFL